MKFAKWLWDTMYRAFDFEFSDKEEAVEFAFQKLASAGELVGVSFVNVPDCRCQKCGELLFDFQRTDRLCVGEAGDMMDCYFDIAVGAICKSCARKVAFCYVE